ncbi:MAG: signal recognition particle-docking protein FtsY [Methanosarcinales archaeon]|jgi:fused signal recognition particle receptor|nr:signal recognition particle-docking protein FtsY [Methanosarcinales archaeon]
MFGKLKEKFKGFKKKVESIIESKATTIKKEEQNSEISLKEEIVKTKSIKTTELTNSYEVQESVKTKSVVPDTISKVKKEKIPQKIEEKVNEIKKPKKIGFFEKAKALVLTREFILDEKDIEDALFDLEIALLESDLAVSVIDEILNSIKYELTGTRKKIGGNTGEIVETALKNSIYKILSANVFDFDEFIKNANKPVHVMCIGINGTGKTTTISKLAKRLKDMDYSIVIAAGDTFRAGAIEQIEVHAQRLGVKLIKHPDGGDPAAVIYDSLQYAKSHKIDVILSDTAGRMHTNSNLMAQLQKVCRIGEPDLIIFVDEAVAGNDAVERAAQFNEAIPIHGSILTKTDADSKGGAAISIAYITNKPILFLGMGQEYDDLKKFDPDWFIEQLFE